ncbi:protein disulfide-isomerase A4-like [Paramacrobiotus metropolitanus]|uniref:protein disulfide-isomerase A4-like n=1 Tax=Paramacrobiotus metropolitanus TaxID=2943436 RepID=UPI0024465066|nr:protein disulfide-isomerase A4-like [Paramacrobiotus metropolitanus]
MGLKQVVSICFTILTLAEKHGCQNARFDNVDYTKLDLMSPNVAVASMDNGVPLITGDTLAKEVSRNDILLIMCYVPWDPKYQAKIKNFETVAKLVLANTEDAMLAKLDMAAEPVAARAVEVQPPELQFILYFRGAAYNVDEFPNAKALAAMVKKLSQKNFEVPQLPYGEIPIKNLSKPDFDKVTNHKEFSLVIFYLPGSSAGERLLYSFELGIHKIKKDKRFGYYKFDATDKPDTLQRFGITKLPALKMFRKGKVFDYRGPKVNPEGITQYLTWHAREPYTEMSHPDDLEKFLKEHGERATVVGFFASKTLSKFQDFVDVAQDYRDEHNFILMPTPMVSQKGSTDEPVQAPGWTLAVILPKRWRTPDDEKKAVLHQEDASYEMIKDFVRWKTTPLAGERTFENAKSLYSLRPLVVAYAKIDWSKTGKKDTEYYRDKVAHAAKDHKDTLFAICNSDNFTQEMERFGFNLDPKYDIHVGILGKDGEYYPRWDTAHMSSKMISEFVNQYKAGEVKPFFRSKSKQQDDPNVLELSSDTFNSKILHSDSHALVLFYHPLSRNWWTAEQSLRALAKDPEFRRRDVIFAQIDASNNDLPSDISLSTYPSIALIPKDNKDNMINYPGELFEEHMVRHFLFEELGKLHKSKPKTEL